MMLMLMLMLMRQMPRLTDETETAQQGAEEQQQ